MITQITLKWRDDEWSYSSDNDLTAEEMVENFVGLLLSQGYIASSIIKALESRADSLREHIEVSHTSIQEDYESDCRE